MTLIEHAAAAFVGGVLAIIIYRWFWICWHGRWW